MWEVELHNQKKANSKVVEPVGSVENWYHNANNYWAVKNILSRNHNRLTTEY